MNRKTVGFAMLSAIAALACDAAEPVSPSLAAAAGATPVISGSGHHVRADATGEELTTFSFTAVRHADGTVSGHYQYDFRLRGFAIHGKVTCVSTSGNQAWVGGTVDKVITDNPAFESLLGLEMWWRSIDNGEDASASPDMTTGVGFELEGNPTTAESWCRDQPAVLPLRVVADGQIQVR